MTETAKQLRWIRNIYEELHFKLGPLPLCIDNQGAIFLASNPAQEGRTKHVQMTEHFIREAVEFGEIHFTMFLPISSSLISSQRTWASRNSKMEEKLFNLHDSNHRNMSSEEEC
jgi:hypothetical protein